MSYEDGVFGFNGVFFWNQVFNLLNELKKLENMMFLDIMCCQYMCVYVCVNKREVVNLYVYIDYFQFKLI